MVRNAAPKRDRSLSAPKGRDEHRCSEAEKGLSPFSPQQIGL
jgi:hypothetical protein